MKLCMNQNQQHVLPLCIKAFNNFLQTTTHIVQHAQHLSCDDISSSTWPIWPSVGSCLSDIAYCRLQLTQTRSAMWVCPGQFQAPPDTSAWGWPTIWCCNTCTTCLPSGTSAMCFWCVLHSDLHSLLSSVLLGSTFNVWNLWCLLILFLHSSKHWNEAQKPQNCRTLIWALCNMYRILRFLFKRIDEILWESARFMLAVYRILRFLNKPMIDQIARTLEPPGTKP